MPSLHNKRVVTIIFSLLYDKLNINRRSFMRAKIIGISIGIILVAAFIPLSLAGTTDAGVELEVKILTGPHVISPALRVKNVGDETAHNVKVTDTVVVGDVLYNNREMKISDSLGPDEMEITSLNTGLIGFGVFSITVNVTCDEGFFSSGVTNGFIIGPFLLIP